MNALRFAIISFFIVLVHSINAQDTAAPVIIAPARDTTFECGQVQGITDKLIAWFNNAGGAIFEDNSGNYTVQTNITLTQAITIFNNSLDVLCGNKQKVEVIFTAVDATGNVSVPTTASFSTTDITPPSINNVPNVQYDCKIGIRDTLIAWIKKKGGYIATDLCSNSVQWTTYTYAIFNNGTQIIAGGGNISSGPYPMIPDGICSWVLRINFFVRDECGNERITPGTTSFSVTDNVAPAFINFPADVTVSCDNIPAIIVPTVIDYCDRSVVPVLNEISTKSSDTTSCFHYNYKITRNWTATDECGNVATATRVLTIQDNAAPEVFPAPSVSISCLDYSLVPDSIYIRYSDNCSNVSVVFSDTLKSSGCTDVVDRTYTLTDVCGNIKKYKQTLNVIQNVKPILLKNAENQTFRCVDQEDFNAKLLLWAQQKGQSNAMASCGQINAFAALKNSYDVNNPATYPGITPTTLPAQICPSPLAGFLRYIEVDFVYFDTCGNHIVTAAVFGVADTLAPVVTDCADNVSAIIDNFSCSKTVKLKVPAATDDCVEASSLVTKKAMVLVTSALPPGPESVIDPALIKIGPFNPFTSVPFSDGIMNIKLINLDIDDATEFFFIYDEDGTLVGTTPLGNDQCATVAMQVTLNKSRIADWILDGFIDFRFVPFVDPGSKVLSINNICNESKIEVDFSFQIDIANAVKKSYIIDDDTEIQLANQDSILIELSKGKHIVRFLLEDCAKNKSECIIEVTVLDTTKPEITCPSNIVTQLSRGVCKDTIPLNTNFVVSENCTGNRIYDQVSPISNEAAAITYSFDSDNNRYLARNKQLIFTNIFPVRNVQKLVSLEIVFFGDNNEPGEYFEILGPGGYVIGNTALVNGNECTSLSVSKFLIPFDIFNSWISNNQIVILAIPKNGNDGINPCQTLTTGQSVDNTSYLRGRLKYSDATFMLSSIGATVFNNQNISGDAFIYDLILNGGISTITVSTSDEEGNSGTCSFEVNVRDTEAPVAKCKNAVVTLHPSGLINSVISPEMVNNGSTDNCSIKSLRVEPSEVNCDMSNKDVNVFLIAEDTHGNVDTCISTVRVKSFELKPTFSAGLCTNDTLKLFANVPISSVPGTYTFRWDGPDNIEFFTENPTIPNADVSYNGVYVLTVTGFNGCVSMGTVTVNVMPLTNPVLTASEKEICDGSEVILSTTSYSGEIFYDWYEGIPTTGILLKSTQNPELILKPTSLDAHFYYVIARGPDCSSNPSPLLKITVLAVPEATVKDLFLSPCEGEEIKLGSVTNNPKYVYQWSGPGGYVSMGANPVIIQNAGTNNAGNYLLVVRNGKCISDTAITRVVIFDRPGKPGIVGADIFCEGVIFSLVATGSPDAEKYEWYLNGVLFSITQENSLIVPLAQSGLQGNWTVKGIKGNCSSLLSATKFVAIDVSLQVGAINSGPICMGDSVKLEATFVPNATYIWSGPVPNIPSVFNPTVAGVPGDYSVIITTPTGCTNNANTTVNVIPVPEITALSNDAKPCMSFSDIITFQPSVFPNSNQYTYKWEGPNGFKSTLRNPTISNLTEKDTGIYTLIIFNKNCPSDPISTEVSFSILPPQPVLSSKAFYCEGDSVIIKNATLVTNGEYIWTTPLGQNSTSVPELKINGVSKTNQGPYSLVIKSGECSSIASTAINIEVRDKPSAPQITSNSPVCYGDTIFLQTNIESGAEYQWTGPNAISSNQSMVSIPDATKSNVGLYQVRLLKDGCQSDASPAVNVVVKDQIKVPAFELESISVCNTNLSGAEICLSSSSLQPGATFTIFNSQNELVLSQGINVCQFITDMTKLNEGPNFLKVVAKLDGCESVESQPLVFNVNTPPAIKATALENDIISCPDETVRLISKDGPPLVDLKWTAVNPNNLISDINAIAPTVSNLQEGENLFYLDYSVDGCTDFTRDTVTVYVQYKPDVNDDVYTLAYGEKGIFNVLVNDQIPDGSILTIITGPKNGTAIINNNLIEFSPDTRFLQTLTLSYSICADFCEDLCDVATVTINFDDNVLCKAPNIITPNDDGYNDYFIIPCLESGKFPTNRLVVFNEWGNEVFYGSPYRNDWSGTFGGNQLPAGTYFYIFDTGDGQDAINGFLILQR